MRRQLCGHLDQEGGSFSIISKCTDIWADVSGLQRSCRGGAGDPHLLVFPRLTAALEVGFVQEMGETN